MKEIFTIILALTRYQRGSRSLAENLSAGTACNPAASVNSMPSSELEDEEEFAVPEETEEVIGWSFAGQFIECMEKTHTHTHAIHHIMISVLLLSLLSLCLFYDQKLYVAFFVGHNECDHCQAHRYEIVLRTTRTHR